MHSPAPYRLGDYEQYDDPDHRKNLPGLSSGCCQTGNFLHPCHFGSPRLAGILGIQLAQPIADLCAFLLAVILNRSVIKEMKIQEKELSQ